MKRYKNGGFTLVEVLAVVVVLGIIMTIAMPAYTGVYNSLKRQTYLNKITEVNIAAESFGNNSEIKDDVKKKSETANDAYGWCRVIYISDLIKAGYLESDSDKKDIITNVYNGKAIGNNLNNSSDKSTVALCYDYDDFEIKSVLVNDLGTGVTYYEGEYIRYVNSSTGFAEFRKVTKSFLYNNVKSAITKELKKLESGVQVNPSATVTVKGKKVVYGDIFNNLGVSKTNDSNFNTALEQVIIKNYTSDEDVIKKHIS